VERGERLPKGTRNVTPRSVILAEYNKLLEEIDASALVQEELRKTDPNLASVSSFLSVVTGAAKRKGGVKEAEDEPIAEAGAKVASTGIVALLTPSAKYLEQQPKTRIVAAKSLLGDELKKTNPSMVSIAAFRKDAHGEESRGAIKSGAVQTMMQENTVGRELVLGGDGHQQIQVSEFPEAKIVMSDDAAMSVGDSEEEETESDDSSGNSESSSDGDSVVSRGNRKKPATESPERGPAGTIRKEFPGMVTRSDAGCRIYVPPNVKTTGIETKDVETTGVGTSGVKTTGVGTTGVETKDVETTGVETTGVETTGVSATGVETTGVGARGVETKDVGATGVGTKDVGATGVVTAEEGVVGMTNVEDEVAMDRGGHRYVRRRNAVRGSRGRDSR